MVYNDFRVCSPPLKRFEKLRQINTIVIEAMKEEIKNACVSPLTDLATLLESA